MKCASTLMTEKVLIAWLTEIVGLKRFSVIRCD